MNTCKTCKWWKLKEGEWENRKLYPTDPDTYKAMEMPFDVRFCNSPLLCRFETPVDKNRASIYDASDYYGEIVTGPDFGCVNHEH